MPARAALAFTRAGAQVFAIAPQGSPLEKVRCIESIFPYSAVNSLDSLAGVIGRVQPDVIVPCDDRVVSHLHLLHKNCADTLDGVKLSSLIERSLGSPSGFSVASSRGKLLSLARDLGVNIPESAVVQRREELKAWLLKHGYPAVLKVDGTWGGTGVRIVQSWGEAEKAFAELTSTVSLTAILGLLSSHNLYPLFSRRDQKRPDVTVQSYIDGYSANSMCACWEGKVLDQLVVQTLFAVDPLGSSTIIKTLSHSQIKEAGQLIVQSLGISGFCGLDFVVDKKSGAAYLIELNPRITQIGHIQIADHHNLISTFYRQLTGASSERAADIPVMDEVIALFPHILRCSSDNPYIHSRDTRYDVPWEEPELIRELMRKPWNGRHLSSFLFNILRRLGEGDLTHLFRRPVKKVNPGRMPNNV